MHLSSIYQPIQEKLSLWFPHYGGPSKGLCNNCIKGPQGDSSFIPKPILFLIMEYAISSKFSIMFNGDPYGYFSSERGMMVRGNLICFSRLCIGMEYLARIILYANTVQGYQFQRSIPCASL